MKKRLFNVLKRYGAILIVLLCYLAWVLITDIKIPCLIYQITSFQCPSCGITRMCLALSRLDFKSAFYYNPYLFVTLPIVLLCVIFGEVEYIRKGKFSLGKLKYLMTLEIVGFVIFGILRNFI